MASPTGNGWAIPYACGFKDQKGRIKTYYADQSDYQAAEVEKLEDLSYPVIQRMLSDLIQRTNANCTFYVHNLSRFDGRFILAALGAMGTKYKVKVVGKGMNEIFKIKISMKVGQNVIGVTLVDSLKILPMSLKKLGKNFKSEVQKGVFPYNFATWQTLNYEGRLPDYEHFESMSLQDYEEMEKQYSGDKV